MKIYHMATQECTRTTFWVHNRNSEEKLSLQDMLGTFISETRSIFNNDVSCLDNIEVHMINMGVTTENIEMQIGQLDTSINSQPKGKFPSGTKINLNEHYKAITLRSNKEVG